MSMAAGGCAVMSGWAGTQYEAKAQGKGNGGGSGSAGGGGNGNGNGGGYGNSGGNGNESGGRSSNNGDGRQGGGSPGSSRDKSSRQSYGGNAATKKDARDVTGSSSFAVQHRTGIREMIQQGRYIMLDKRGRTIINRRATNADRLRLRSLLD